MHELPDVEHFKRVLAQNGLDRTIESAVVNDARILGEFPVRAFTTRLCGESSWPLGAMASTCWQSSMPAAG